MIDWVGVAVWVVALASLFLLSFGYLVGKSGARERYAGEFDNVDPATRQWFKSIRSPHGVPCCDVADGRRTDYDIRPDGYWIPDPAALGPLVWVRVPPEAVVYNAGNPVGEAVVWYVVQGPGRVYIRCFVPGGGV